MLSVEMDPVTRQQLNQLAAMSSTCVHASTAAPKPLTTSLLRVTAVTCSNVVTLFNPRSDRWPEHFEFNGPEVEGLTAVGRATVLLLNMNAPRRARLRAERITRTGRPD